MQEQNPTNRLRNLIVIAALLLIAAVLVFLSSQSGGTKDAFPPSLSPVPGAAEASPAPENQEKSDVKAFLLITVAGRPYAVEPLDEERDIEINQPTGERNVIHITPAGFHMAYSTCDNQLCVGQGEVTIDNYTRRILGPYVLCLPNQVQLQLRVVDAQPDPEAPDI